jgi:GR25 family glycosyltransferase involved in LPS biosynthesis
MDKLNLIPIYWINLNKSSNRRNHMNKVLYSTINIRIQAINGLCINFNKLILPVNYNGTNLEIACLCSHLKAIYHAYIAMEDMVIISEDDVDFNLFIKWNGNFMDIIQLAPVDWEILQLNTSNPETIKTSILLYNKNNTNMWSKWNNYSSTVIYLINRKGMKKLIDIFIKHNKGIIYDLSSENLLLADVVLYKNTITYTLNIPIFNYLTLDSNIHDDHLIYQSITREIINKLNSEYL